MTIVGQIEIDDYCQRILKLRWPEVPKHDDIKTLNSDTLVSLFYNGLNEQEKQEVNEMAHRKDYDEAVRMYERGLSVGDVADFFNVSRQSMWQVLKLRGCKFRAQLKYGKENHFHRETKANDHAQNILEVAIRKGIIERKTHCGKCSEAGTYHVSDLSAARNGIKLKEFMK